MESRMNEVEQEFTETIKNGNGVSSMVHSIGGS